MNKSAYIEALKASLAKLSPEERDDILRDMEEYFYEASRRGLSEEEIVAKLGSPQKMSETIMAEVKVKAIATANTVPQKTMALLSAILAMIVLAPFTFIIILIPLFIIGVLLFSLWPMALFLLCSLPFILLAAIFMMLEFGFHLMVLLAVLFFVLGWGASVFAVIVGLSFLSFYLFKFITKLCQWQINFIKKQMRG